MDDCRVFRFGKVPGPYAGGDDDGCQIAVGKRSDVAEILKARAAALQATGVSAKVEEVDEQGRVLHTFPFYSDGPMLPLDEAEAAAEQEAAEAALAEAEGEAEEEARSLDAEADAEGGDS